MPSHSYRQWRTVRAAVLDEIARAQASPRGTKGVRRYMTRQLTHSYALLLAAQFQGFCRDLHTECVNHLLGVMALPPDLDALTRGEYTRGRQLDRGNAQPSSIGADFNRLGIEFWKVLHTAVAASVTWKDDLDMLNEWRNAIAHDDFTSPRLAGAVKIRLSQVRRWRMACRHLARHFDDTMRQHLQSLTGISPW
jgi:hypothetical protein